MFKFFVFVAAIFSLQQSKCLGSDGSDPTVIIDDSMLPKLIVSEPNEDCSSKTTYQTINVECPVCPSTDKIADDKGIKNGYKTVKGFGAYKAYEKADWYTARRTCEDDGAHLLIMRSEMERKIIEKMLANEDTYSSWLGIHNLFNFDDWITVLDEPIETLEFGSWFVPGQRNDIPSCAGFQEGKINDWVCDHNSTYICKKDLIGA